jgi:hypothetical protein
MTEIKFRRSTDSRSTGKKRGSASPSRRALAVIVAIIFLAVLFFVLPRLFGGAKTHIDLYCVGANEFVIDGDTTNFDQLASLLLKRVGEQKKQKDSAQIAIRVHIPPNYQAANIQDLLPFVQAVHPIFELKIAQ